MLDDQPARLAAVPALTGIADQTIQGSQFTCGFVHLVAVIAALDLLEKGQRVSVIGHHRAGRHVGRDKNGDACVSQHQMEGQADYPEQVVCIEPGTLAVGLRPEGEEVLENPPVNDDSGHQRDQHEHAGKADDVHADRARLKVVVQGEEELTPQRVRHGLSGSGIESCTAAFASTVFLPTQLPVRFAFGRTVQPVGMQRPFHIGVQPLPDVVSIDGAGCRHVQRGPHPAFDFLVEAGQRAGEQNDEQQPAWQKPAPGMQPGHRLT